MTTRAVEPADLRAQRARLQVPLFLLAADVRVHPGRLGMMLNERLPLPLELAARISEALNRREAAMTG